MTEPTSPWAQHAPDESRPEFTTTTPPSAGGSTPIGRAAPANGGAPANAGAPIEPERARHWGAGNVTGGPDLTVAIEPLDPDDDPPLDDDAKARRTYKWFGGAAAAVVTIGVVILLALVMTGRSPFHREPSGPPDVAPPLAKACPALANAPVAPQSIFLSSKVISLTKLD